MVDIKVYHVSPVVTNCVYIVDKTTGKSAVVDAGGKNDKLIQQIKEDGGKLDYVMLTHGHYDHIMFAKQLANMFGAKIITGEENKDFLIEKNLNGTGWHDFPFEPFFADILLKDNDVFMLGETEIKYISTPGHTKGCGCFIFDDYILSGDCLFRESFGRTDLPTGNMKQLMESFKKLKNIDKDYKIIPGHGAFTTLMYEKNYNPLMERV